MATGETDAETPDDDLAYAIGRYVLGDVSLGRSAELAGVSRWRMMNLLQEHGVELQLGPESIDEAQAEAEGRLGEYLASENE